MGEDLDDAAANLNTTSPVVLCIESIDGNSSYCLGVEKKVLITGIPSMCKALALWFCLHYVFHLEYGKTTSDVAVFLQEFVFGLPATRAKKVPRI